MRATVTTTAMALAESFFVFSMMNIYAFLLHCMDRQGEQCYVELIATYRYWSMNGIISTALEQGQEKSDITLRHSGVSTGCVECSGRYGTN
jgi:hypothetical protein